MCIFKSWFRKLRSFVVRAAISMRTARQSRQSAGSKFAFAFAIAIVFTFAFALLAVISADVGFAQTSEGLTPKAKESSTDVGQVDREIITEINEIRRNLGGGLSQEFGAINDSLERNSKALSTIIGKATPEVLNKATDRTTSADTLFGQELTRFVMGQAVDEPINETGSDQSSEALSTSVLQRPADRAMSQLPQDASSQQQVLRRCARGLEQLAEELEQIEAYENADNLRNEADELWKKARTVR